MEFDIHIKDAHILLLHQLLPEHWSGIVTQVEDLPHKGISCLMRLKIFTKEDALDWLQDFQKRNSVHFRVGRTHPGGTQRVLFKKEFNCVYNPREKRGITPRAPTLHPKCHAKLTITVKNKSMKRSADAYLKTHPCEVFLRHNHNHPFHLLKGKVRRFKRSLPRCENEVPETSEEATDAQVTQVEPQGTRSGLLPGIKIEQEDTPQFIVVRCSRPVAEETDSEAASFLESTNSELVANQELVTPVALCRLVTSGELVDSSDDISNSDSTARLEAKLAVKTEVEPDLEVTRKQLSEMVDFLMDKVKNNFEQYDEPMQKFLESFESCKNSDATLVSALENFGKVGDSSSSKINSRKRKNVDALSMQVFHLDHTYCVRSSLHPSSSVGGLET